MTAAVMPYAAEYFITPMAAVAGAVAEEILASIVRAAELSRAYVNNGGDIALHLSADEQQGLFRCAGSKAAIEKSQGRAEFLPARQS